MEDIQIIIMSIPMYGGMIRINVQIAGLDTGERKMEM